MEDPLARFTMKVVDGQLQRSTSQTSTGTGARVKCRQCGWSGVPKLSREERTVGHVGISNEQGGLLARPITETNVQTLCPDCGGLINNPALKRAHRKGETDAMLHLALIGLVTVAVVGLIIFLLTAALPKE